MRNIIAAIAVTGMVAASAQAFSGAITPQPQFGMPIAGGQAKPLPEAKGVVSWMTLAQVDQVKLKNRVVPQFSDAVLELDSKQVRLQGFMMPLETGARQKHFLLSAMPVTCAFCLPGGPEALIEVKSKNAIAYTIEPLLITGRLAVLKDDPAGLYYRLTDASVVAK